MSEKTLSIFIDESGDFGSYTQHSPYYLVTMILHNQNTDISQNILALETHLNNLGYPQHAIHTGPLIRRESVYSSESREKRKKGYSKSQYPTPSSLCPAPGTPFSTPHALPVHNEMKNTPNAIRDALTGCCLRCILQSVLIFLL